MATTAIQLYKAVYQSGRDYNPFYPVNMRIVAQGTGFTESYFRTAEGVELVTTLPGVDRGGVVLEDKHYRVAGDKFGRVLDSGSFFVIGSVDATNCLPNERCSYAYSFDRLALSFNNKMYLYNIATNSFLQVTDPDLGVSLAVTWIDGYFISTDGDYIVVTELANPSSIDPLKYGSSEIDPDPLVSVIRINNTLVTVNRHTIELFDNVGGTGFPFQRIEGATVYKGSPHRNMVTTHDQVVYIVGSGRAEPLSIYRVAGTTAEKISNRYIDALLNRYTVEDVAEQVSIEIGFFGLDAHLLLHLHDRTMAVSLSIGDITLWFELRDGEAGKQRYTARNFLFHNNDCYVGHAVEAKLGKTTDAPTMWGNNVQWELVAQNIPVSGNRALIRRIDLDVGGKTADTPPLTNHYIGDNNWSPPRAMMKIGAVYNLYTLRNCGIIAGERIQRFFGTSANSQTILSFKLDAEPLGF